MCIMAKVIETVCLKGLDHGAEAVASHPRIDPLVQPPPALTAAAMISSATPALLSASTIAVNLLGTVIGDSPRIPTGAQDRPRSSTTWSIERTGPHDDTDNHLKLMLIVLKRRRVQ